ncbi:MAG: YihY/virulence factor BrkB family protein [Nocardioidaceae bacterium]
MGFDVGKLWNRYAVRPVDQLRDRVGWFDHLVAMLAHYGRVNGGGLAGAVTYYAFLAFVPVLALAFFVVGLVARIYPDAQADMSEVISRFLRSLLGTDTGSVSVQAFADNAGTAGIIALVGFGYAGIGLMSSLRQALQTMFGKPPSEQPNFVFGKLRDLAALFIIGGLLVLAFVVGSVGRNYADDIVGAIGLDSTWASRGLQLLGLIFSVALITAVLYVLYQFLARPRVSRRGLWEGTFLAAIGFVVLKYLAGLLISFAHGRPAFAIFGVSLVLLIMINYFIQVVMYGAAWAQTSPKPADLNLDESVDSTGE